MPITIPSLEEFQETTKEKLSILLAQSGFAFLRARNALRPLLCKARLGVSWKPEFELAPADLPSGLNLTAFIPALVAAYYPLYVRHLETNQVDNWKSGAWNWLRQKLYNTACNNDSHWCRGVAWTPNGQTERTPPPSEPARPTTVELEVEVHIDAWRRMYEEFDERRCGDIELDREAVAQLLLDDDEDEVLEMIGDAIGENYMDWDPDIVDGSERNYEETDYGTGDGGWELTRHSRAGILISRLREELADDIERLRAERDAENDEEDEEEEPEEIQI